MDTWEEGQDAWRRLAERYQDIPAYQPADRALEALSDVGLIRRLLEQAEFEAVRDARAQGKSWSEIAVRLGVTRQSAWERWRDIDDPAEHTGEPDIPETDIPDTPYMTSSVSARVRRRRGSVTVPNVIGMTWPAANRELSTKGLVAIGHDPDGPPSLAWVPDDAVITDQSPESGAKVPPGSAVRLWVDREGGAGVREPRRPRPDPKAGRKMRDELTDEAV